MAQKILIRRGTEAQRLTIGTIPSVGELLYTTDRSEIFVGDGSAAYGVPLNYIKAAGNGVDQTITGNIGITGNLTVTGDVTQTTSNNVVIGDSIILLNADSADTPVNDAGFEIERGLSTNVSILWDEGLDQWLLNDASTSERILTSGDLPSSGDFTLDGLSDTTITANSPGEILKWSGSAWINNTLAEAGIQPAGSYQPLDGDLTSIAGLAGTSGLLKKTAANTWELDTAAYSTTVGTVTSVTPGTSLEISAGSSTVNPTIGVASNGISATQLNVTGNGTNGQILSSDADGSFTWIPAPSGTTNLSIGTTTATSIVIDSSTGTGATIPQAIATSAAGLLSGADKAKLDAITGTNTGDEVAASTTTAGIIELATATETDAGTLTNRAVTPASLTNILSDVSTNNSKVSNVTTNLGYTAAATIGTVTSSDGTNATLPAATTSLAGLLTGVDKTKLNGIATGATANVGTVTSVTAGAGMTQTGTSTINPTLNVIAGDTSLTVSANSMVVNIVDGGTFV